jgi:hypothetical protein
MKQLLLLLCMVVIAPAITIYCGTTSMGYTIPFEGTYYDECRLQILFLKGQLTTSGTISEIAFKVQADGSSGMFQHGNVKLCHTDQNSVDSNFESNYGGFSPITTLSNADIPVAGIAGAWVPLEFSLPFAYSNSHNLLVDLSWEGDNGVEVPVFAWNPAGLNRHVYAEDLTSPIGTTGQLSYYMRFIISGTAVEPNSLGRIKGMYVR